MILVASQRSGATALADHLTNLRDNDHVEVLALDGFIADDLHGALSEAHAISKATRCRQYLFSVSLNPPGDAIVSESQFEAAADRIAEKLGLSDQPRALVIHEKEGRRHAHSVWSRIDAATMTAINLSHFKTKLRDLSRELFLDHGWELPNGLQSYGGKNPLNFTLAEWQQAMRQNVDPREIKQVFRQAWERSDTLLGLKNALSERGFHVAKGDRRGIVAVDIHGEVYSLSRWLGVKAKDMRARCGPGSDLPSVAEVKATLRIQLSDQLRGFIGQFKAKHAIELEPFNDERAMMVKRQREERCRMTETQDARAAAENAARMTRLNGGLRGLFDRLTGRHARVKDANLREAMLCAKRDQAERDVLILSHIQKRQELQERFKILRRRQAGDRKIMARDIASTLKRTMSTTQSALRSRHLRRQRGPRLER